MSGGGMVRVVLGGFTVLLLALAGLSGWQGVARLTGRDDATGEVQDVARAFAEAYGTVDARAPDAYQERMLRLTTGRLHAALLQMDVAPAATQGRTLTTRVLSVQVTSLVHARATADVIVEQRRQTVDPATGGAWEDQVGARLICRLVRTGGRWLVEEVRLVPIGPPVQGGREARSERVEHRKEVYAAWIRSIACSTTCSTSGSASP